MNRFIILTSVIVAIALSSDYGLAKKSKYKGGPVSGGGTIAGVVIKKGAPKDSRRKVTKNSSHCGDSVAAEESVVNKAGKVRWAVAMLDGITAGKPLDKKAKVVLDNKGCRFAPHVMVAPTKAKLTVRNSDPMLHNAHFYLVKGDKKKNVINLALPRQDQEIKKGKILRKSGLLSVLCDAHDFMQAWVWSLPHPYGVVTDAKGSFKLTDVPAGKHTLKIWHEKFGEKVVDVTVKSGKTTNLKISL